VEILGARAPLLLEPLLRCFVNRSK
jgi:hypothetical protein